MKHFLFSLLTALFPGIQKKPVPPLAVLQPASAALQQPAEPSYSRPPVDAATAARARATVKREELGGAGAELRYRFTFADGSTVEFPTRPKRMRDLAKRERVIGYVGTESASREPSATFEAAGKTAGLTPQAVEALRFVSRHEGGFDAINTWDRARFSWGFIQFAGGEGRGFRPALALFKQRSPELFQKYLADYGLDVLPGRGGNPEPVYVDPASGEVLRGDEAEQAFGDDLLAVALFVRAGRLPEVKQRQVEAAIRDYASPALRTTVDNVRLSDVMRSPQGHATLIDRKVHEGNVSRLEWALVHSRMVRGVPDPGRWHTLEGEVLDLAIRDSDARAQIVEAADAAVEALERAATAAGNGNADDVPDGPSLAAARDAFARALYQADYRMVVSFRRDALHYGFTDLLATTTPERIAPLAPAALAAELTAAAEKTRGLVSRYRFEYGIRDRLRNIRRSELAGPPATSNDVLAAIYSSE